MKFAVRNYCNFDRVAICTVGQRYGVPSFVQHYNTWSKCAQ